MLSLTGMLRPRGQIIRPWPHSGLGLDLDLMASGLDLIDIGLVASNMYSAHDISSSRKSPHPNLVHLVQLAIHDVSHPAFDPSRRRFYRLCNERKVTGRGVGSECGVARRRR